MYISVVNFGQKRTKRSNTFFMTVFFVFLFELGFLWKCGTVLTILALYILFYCSNLGFYTSKWLYFHYYWTLFWLWCKPRSERIHYPILWKNNTIIGSLSILIVYFTTSTILFLENTSIIVIDYFIFFTILFLEITRLLR